MGFSISWLAFQGLSPKAVLGRLSLKDTREVDEVNEAPISGASFPSGWYVIFYNNPNPPSLDEIARLSKECELLVGQVEEHDMISGCWNYADGKHRWSVLHDSSRGMFDLTVAGTPPPFFTNLRSNLIQKQESAGADDSTDYLFDIPVEACRETCGFRYDQRRYYWGEPRFTQLESVDPAKASYATKLQKALAEPLAAHGFRFNRSRGSFQRRRQGQTDFFSVVCRQSGSEAIVNLSVGVRVELIESIFHRTSGWIQKSQNDTSTMGTSVRTLGGLDDLVIASDRDLEVASEQVLGVFETVALPYFEKWGSLHNIDAELNGDPGRQSAHRTWWLRQSTAIIAAKLLGRPDYEKLAEFYSAQMRESYKGFYLKRYQALLESLQTVEPIGVWQEKMPEEPAILDRMANLVSRAGNSIYRKWPGS